MPDPRPRPSLFAQIAWRLAVVAAVFACLDIGLVVGNYARDQQAMAEDLVGGQADRIDQAMRGDLAGRPPTPVAAPLGAKGWAYAVVDARRQRIIAGGKADLAGSIPAPDLRTLDWTRRDGDGAGVRITGVRRFEGPAGPRWVLVGIETDDWRIYLPVIAGELADHVALPLVPLMLLLLGFNVVVVRRMLAPLTAAAAEVDALDPGRMDARIVEPAGSREVAALVAAVNRALDRLQQAMGLLKAFTADAAHELRTPLSVLKLRVEALPDSPDKLRLREDVQGMARLVNQMLDLSQADALRIDQASEVDLRALAQEVVAQTAPLAFAAGQDIRLTDLGPAPCRGDADALARALRNLVENAIRHGAGSAPIEVSVGPGPRLSVRDHGPGLGEADPEMIFRRFWRRERGKGEGAGLGLGIARSIVEAHGGMISAQNAPGGGAIFTCAFPSAAAHRVAGDSLRGASSSTL